MNMENQTDKIITRNIEEEMKTSYIDYAMSVIVARALPDARDGLKPVHRRILYSMNELNLDPTKAYKKSARITGDTMGKYHPHGNLAIYDAMVRMAQDFSLRYPLVDGHGNFGSMDGDRAAAERYTEARLSRIAMEMLNDIEKDTVDFIPNYDGEFEEPTVLPSKFPNLLVNGSSGIAVGMATNIPPHNLSEVIDGAAKLIDDRLADRETDVEDIIQIIKGPDFPTGGTILGTSGIKDAYRTGRGKIALRADAAIEPMDKGSREMIVVTELPYQVNKARLVEKIGELVRDKKIDGITDLRDESDRNGVRIVIELRKDANANVILNQLYKFTQMQDSVGIIMLALAGGEPAVLNIKELLEQFVGHQKEVVTRRSRFDLIKAEKRAHIIEGYFIALDNIDEVIAIIRASADTPEAKERLAERFGLTEEQVSAIVDMRLRTLTGLERGRLQQEYGELAELIKELRGILENEKRLYEVIREELLIIKSKYGDERRTKIAHDEGEINYEDLIDDETSVITLTHMNYIKRQPLSVYKLQNRGGKGVIGMGTREEDAVKDMFVCNTHHFILFFTNRGRVFRLKAYEVPEAGRAAKGTNIVNLLNLDGGEKVAAVIPIDEYVTGDYLLMATRLGVVKKTSAGAYENIKKAGLRALNIREDDELISVIRTDGNKEIFIATKLGMGIRFGEDELRPLGRAAAGVIGIRMNENDYVVGAGTIEEDMKILLVSEKGYGKRTDYGEFRLQGRGGKGTRIYKTTEKTGPIAGVMLTREGDELMIINSEGVIIRIETAKISTIGRVTQGVKLISLDESVTVVSIAKITAEEVANE